MLVYMASNYNSQIHTLERSLAMALGAAAQAEHDLNSVRLRAGLPPYKYFHLSAAVVPEAKVGPKTGGVRLSSETWVEAAMVARGEAVDMAAAHKLRLVEKNR